MQSFNRLAARKDIGAIHHRLAEVGLSVTLRHQLIARHLDNLADNLPQKYQGIVKRCQVANYNDPLELVAGLDLLAALIPATYGSIPAGTVFQINGRYFIKRKGGVEYRGVVEPHFDAGTIVTIVNDGVA